MEMTSLPQSSFIVVWVVVNIFTFLCIAFDHKQSETQRKQKTRKYLPPRVQSDSILYLTLLGGGFGGILAMYCFDYKLGDTKFIYKWVYCFLTHIAVLSLVFYGHIVFQVA